MLMINRPATLMRLVLLGLLGLAATVHAAFDGERFSRDLQALAAPSTRSAGSPGYNAALNYLTTEIRALPGVKLQVHEFDMLVPQTTEATLTIAGRSVPVFPLFPAGVRLNTTPAEGLTGKLVYCGTAEYKELKPTLIDGNIAVVESSAKDKWRNLFYFGARAVIIIGSKDLSQLEMRSHELPIAVNLPRFFVGDDGFAEQMRSSGVADGYLKVSASWKRVKASNLYAYVSPKNPLPASFERGNAGKAWAALTIVAPFDATGVAYDLSPAAGQAVQTAAALEMLRDFANNPPRRPVMVAFTGADAYNLMGSRQMMMALGDAPRPWQGKIDEEADPQLKAIEHDLSLARGLNGDPTWLDIVRHRTLINRIIKVIETDVALGQDELFRLRVLPAEQLDDAKRKQIDDVQSRLIRLGQIRFHVTASPKSLAEFGQDAPAMLQRVMTRLGDTSGTEGLLQQWQHRKQQLERRIELYQWLAKNLNDDLPGSVQRSNDPNPRNNDDRLIELMVGLDLADMGQRVGPVYWGAVAKQSAITQIQEHREWFEKAAGNGKPETAAAWFKPLAKVMDFEPLKLTRTPVSYLTAPIGLPVEVGVPWGIPAFTMATLEDLRPRRDTPADTLANLRLDSIKLQAAAVLDLLRQAWDDPKFLGQPEYRRNINDFKVQVVSTASGKPIPDLPRDGFIATYEYITSVRKIPPVRWMPYAVGVRRLEIVNCDSEGRYEFEGLPRVGDLKLMAVNVYRFEPGTGAILSCTDLGKQAADLKQTVNLDQTIVPLKSVVFDCQEYTLLGLYDPRFLQSLGEVQLMDARRNSEPQRFNAALYNQMMAGALEPGSRAYLLFRYGRIGNRIALLNMPEANKPRQQEGARGEGDGYLVKELSRLGPIALVTATDFWRLNESRIEQYRKAGVSSTLIDTMHGNAAAQIDTAKKLLQADDADGMMRNATGGWADEARVYDAVQKMANDVIYAAIFLLLLSVPFAFCMERLVIGTPSIYRQIAYASGIFALMAAALWMFHPAFKISSSPLIIILAFAIVLMSLIVISVVYGKFDTELKRLRSGRGTSDGASIASASVLMSAVMLGIANMRRRKFRTALTSITVVLITFAVLCFTSASRYQSTISLPTGVDATYPGLLLRQRGFRSMPVEAIDSLKSAYVGQTFVQRWWTLNAGDTKDQVHLVAGGVGIDGAAARVVPVQAMLGLSPGESLLSPISQVITNFDRLENGETNIVYLSQSTLDQMKLKVGGKLQIAGMQLEIAGTYDANDFDQRVNTLSGESIAPLKYSSGALDASGRKLTDGNDANTLDLDANSSAAEASATYEHLPSTQFAIVPAAISKRLENTTLRTVGVRVAADDDKPADRDAKVKAIVDDMTKRFALATFAGYSDGVKLVSASNLSSIGGGANVAIPLAIGGLIIFNTMMGSIAERRREIHVYTSLGLAPFHVGVLFVAEALTYGLIGSVFGYIIGQGAGTALLKLGWLGNVTMNYSGTSAMMTMGLILLIVLLSALVPARLASKIAAPSIERSWRVPAPKDDQIIAGLPFTINRTAAQGVVAYLAEFFEAHQEGSIGKFSAGKIEAFSGQSGDGKPTRGLKTVIWLTPFDLGVRQHLLLLIHPGEFPDIYEVQVVLQRLSGDDGSWWRMNRSFLTELRKQFLQWRSLSPLRMKDYVDESKKLFKVVPDEVVTTEASEVVRLA
ncbi:MAG: ABC transporter permease [Burkholderiales bacterium]|nr:ABC transporter permease [Phycisphaerae bacterium]